MGSSLGWRGSQPPFLAQDPDVTTKRKRRRASQGNSRFGLRTYMAGLELRLHRVKPALWCLLGVVQ